MAFLLNDYWNSQEIDLLQNDSFLFLNKVTKKSILIDLIRHFCAKIDWFISSVDYFTIFFEFSKKSLDLELLPK